jgi:hypothetical protein
VSSLADGRLEKASEPACGGTDAAMIRLTSLLRVEERLLEADYFAGRLARLRGENHGYELNAFLSAARSVTFLIQKELSKVPGFMAWWETQRRVLGDDAAASFFLELRNFSQKQGRVSVVGSGSRRGGRSRWTYYFAGTVDPVPAELLNRDVVDCCREHVAKLAALVLRCIDSFPHNCCPTLALTPEGVDALGLALDDVDEALGLARGYTAVGPFSRDERIHMLQRQVGGLDFEVLQKLAAWKPRRRPKDVSPSGVLGERLRERLVARLEGRRSADPAGNPLVDVLAAEVLLAEDKV